MQDLPGFIYMGNTLAQEVTPKVERINLVRRMLFGNGGDEWYFDVSSGLIGDLFLLFLSFPFSLSFFLNRFVGNVLG